MVPYEKKSITIEKEIDMQYFDSLLEEDNTVENKLERNIHESDELENNELEILDYIKLIIILLQIVHFLPKKWYPSF